jgi:hypothetical protein
MSAIDNVNAEIEAAAAISLNAGGMFLGKLQDDVTRHA